MFLHALIISFLLEFTLGISDDYYIAPKFPCSSQSKELAACINRYTEKDFFSISPFIYGKQSRTQSYAGCSRRSETAERATGGQEFEENCNHLYEVIHCLKNDLKECDRISGYFLLRNLLYFLEKVIELLCGVQHNNEDHITEAEASATHKARVRFVDLLSSLECLECVRTNLTKEECDSTAPVTDPHLWTKVLRLELGPIEVCPALKKQLNCIESRQLVIKNCNSVAYEIHSNLTSLLVSTWCNKNPLFYSSSIRINYLESIGVILLCIFAYLLL